MSTFCAVELHLQKAMIRIEKEKMNGAVFFRDVVILPLDLILHNVHGLSKAD
jgi:hypothetical protein